MDGVYESKIANCCVANLGNSGAIACDLRLTLGDFESRTRSPRIDQRFPGGYLLPLQSLFSIRFSMIGCRMISMAKPILPPGTTIELRRDMNAPEIIDNK